MSDIEITREQMIKAINFYLQFYYEDWGLEKNVPYDYDFIVDKDLKLVFRPVKKESK